MSSIRNHLKEQLDRARIARYNRRQMENELHRLRAGFHLERVQSGARDYIRRPRPPFAPASDPRCGGNSCFPRRGGGGGSCHVVRDKSTSPPIPPTLRPV